MKKRFSDFLDEAGRCWPGYRPVKGKKAFTPGSCVKEDYEADDGPLTQEQLEEVAAWQRKEGKNPEGGLNQKGV